MLIFYFLFLKKKLPSILSLVVKIRYNFGSVILFLGIKWHFYAGQVRSTQHLMFYWICYTGRIVSLIVLRLKELTYSIKYISYLSWSYNLILIFWRYPNRRWIVIFNILILRFLCNLCYMTWAIQGWWRVPVDSSWIHSVFCFICEEKKM
jgi:hypothetical protein